MHSGIYALFLSAESDTNSTLQIRTWKLRKKRDRFLVSKVAFNLPISSEIKVLTGDPVFSRWVMLS